MDFDSKPSWADQVEEEGDEDSTVSEILQASQVVRHEPKIPGETILMCAELGYQFLLSDSALLYIMTAALESAYPKFRDQMPMTAEVFATTMDEWIVARQSTDKSIENTFQRNVDGSRQRGPLPSPKELIKGNIKTIIEYKIDEDGKKLKIIRTFRIETRKASKAVARRKNWKKFGTSEYDPPGPNVATTTVSDDVYMTFITSKEDLNNTEEDDPMSKLKGQKIVSCRICKGDHWTTRCPYKDTLGPMQKELAEQLGLSTAEKEKGSEPEPVQPAQSKTGKYVPPSLRDGANRRGESMQTNRRADDNATIRVTNLSEDTRETDLQELFRPFGSISRIYLAKDKNTGQSKGFAFISFHRREDAARAIAGVSGFGYDHLILNVEWAKPSNS